MKKVLISLHTEDPEAVFDNVFNDEIVIQPNSEIAFHSCCLRLNNFRINVDNSNKLITLKLGSSPPMDFVIESGEYADHQVEYLLEKIQNGFNQRLLITNQTDNGTQIRFTLSRKNIVSLDLIKASISQASVVGSAGAYEKNTDLFLYGTGIAIDGATGTLSRTGSQSIADGLQEYIHGRVPTTRGCGFCSILVKELRSFTASGLDGAIMMITEESNPGKFQSRTSCLFYVRIPEQIGHSYKWTSRETSYNEVELTSGGTPVACQLNDTVQIELTGGKYILQIYRPSAGDLGDTSMLRFEAPVYNDSEIESIAPALYMTVGLLGPSFSGIINYMSDPFISNPPTFSLAIPSIQDAPPSFSKGDEIDHVLTFQKLDLATSFGYDAKQITVTDTDQATILAPQSIVNSNHPSNYKIELLNIQLESFDSQREGRMNILSTIPTSKEFRDDQLSVLNFEPSNMFYLSIRNKNEMSLRNIRARVIDANNDPINLLGFSSINLLIKPSEMK